MLGFVIRGFTSKSSNNIIVNLHEVITFLVSMFFFLCCVHNHDLHSFPTRRSSDLEQHSEAEAEADAIARRFGRAAMASDRKSTRLNSSHTVISYAVFCLKKKNYLQMKK